MKWSVVIVLGLAAVMPAGHAAGPDVTSGLPADVAAFKERRDLCDHFRGEDPYDDERRQFLHHNLEKYCTGTDREFASLKAKYAGHDTVQKALAEYEETIE